MISKLVAFAFVFVIRAYQFAVRPLLFGSCRFVPSCSEYATEAVGRHGPWRGGWMALKRIGRCRPGARGGYDPVPRA